MPIISSIARRLVLPACTAILLCLASNDTPLRAASNPGQYRETVKMSHPPISLGTEGTITSEAAVVKIRNGYLLNGKITVAPAPGSRGAVDMGKHTTISAGYMENDHGYRLMDYNGTTYLSLGQGLGGFAVALVTPKNSKSSNPTTADLVVYVLRNNVQPKFQGTVLPVDAHPFWKYLAADPDILGTCIIRGIVIPAGHAVSLEKPVTP